MNTLPPISVQEMERILRMAELDLDYSESPKWLQDLTEFAAKVAGTPISLVNLIDSFTQWTISNYGLQIGQMRREDSVCQYTIAGRETYEVKDLSQDPRFHEKFYVAGEPSVRYYFGVPLTTNEGFNLGALCVLDQAAKDLAPGQVEMLQIIAREIVNRLVTSQVLQDLKYKLKEAMESQRKVAHDIRGPLGGIIGLAEIISDQGEQNKMGEVLEFIGLIQKSGTSLLELTDEILTMPPDAQDAGGNSSTSSVKPDFNLQIFREKLLKLFTPQALAKKIDFQVDVVPDQADIPFSKCKLLQIAGNLISNAIKFTPENGSVSVSLDLIERERDYELKILVLDTGGGLMESEIQAIYDGSVDSTEGTKGECGYGLGLSLVNHLVSQKNGSLKISSTPGKGAAFEVRLPLMK